MPTLKADNATSSGDLGTAGSFVRGTSFADAMARFMAGRQAGTQPALSEEENIRLSINRLLKDGDISGAIALSRAALAAKSTRPGAMVDALPRATVGGIPGVSGPVPGLAQGGHGPDGDQSHDEPVRGQAGQLPDDDSTTQTNPMTPGKGSFDKEVVQPMGNPGLKYTNEAPQSASRPDDVRDDEYGPSVADYPGMSDTPNTVRPYGQGPNGAIVVKMEDVFPYWLLGGDRYSAQARQKAADEGKALPDGSFPIRDKGELGKAKKAFGRAKNKAKARAHINKRAKALGAPPLGGDAGKMAAEIAAEFKAADRAFAPVLWINADMDGVHSPEILAEGDESTGKGMRVRVPFYVGDSIAKLPDFGKRVFFDKALLPGIVAEGKAKLAEAKQPLTVYARHAHATMADRLPVGTVVDLEQQGRVGYATLEIAPTSEGKDVQVLLRSKQLNAVSLRSKRFELADRKVNGEAVYTPTKLGLDGIDFAPDSPAMPTFGVEVLAAENVRISN